MPTKVKMVRWRCPQCGKHRWLKPHQARDRRFCSRACQYEGARVANPVRAKQSARRTYGVRVCARCRGEYEARHAHQRYCSQGCALYAAQSARIRTDVVPVPCEECGKVFRPRPGSAMRFCSRSCTYAGQRGSKSAIWRGGRHIDGNGYVKAHAPGHPAAHGKGSYVAEHRLVMEKMLGRFLRKDETVHHKNGNKADNRPENLEIRVGRHGKGATSPHCRTCTCFADHAVVE